MVYIMNYYTGKTANFKMAAYWVQENREIFEQNFAVLGVSNGQPGPLIHDESANVYIFYATGRVNCNYAMTTLELKKRHDLLSIFVLGFIWPGNDKITIEKIPIDLKPPTPIVLAVVKKQQSKKFQENNSDIKKLCRRMKYDSLGSEWVVFGEFEETTDYFLTDSIVSLFNKNSSKIQILSLSDQRVHEKLILKCEMLFASDFVNESKQYTTILRGLFYLVDQIANYKMSQLARQKAEKERQVLESTRQKENTERRKEELERKREEKKKAEEEKKKVLSKEQLRKQEEKDEKRDQKKKLRSKYVKIQ